MSLKAAMPFIMLNLMPYYKLLKLVRGIGIFLYWDIYFVRSWRFGGFVPLTADCKPLFSSRVVYTTAVL